MTSTTREKYPTLIIGDYVVVFTHWNTRPQGEGKVIAQTEHFVKIQRGVLFKTDEWISKENVEKVIPLISKLKTSQETPSLTEKEKREFVDFKSK